MNARKKKRLVLITLVYWFLLVYILAALFFWFISLNAQNNRIIALKLGEISTTDPQYNQKVAAVKDEQRRKSAQYIGEGAAFFLVIAVGAVFVYRATRRQIRLSQQQENFMMAVTHELKTPIAVAKLNLETMLRRQLEETKREKLLQDTLQETNRLNQLSSNILLASQLESGNYISFKQEVDLGEVVTEAVADFSNRFPQRTIIAKPATDIYINGESLLLKMLVNNLVENALKYSPKDKAVTVELSEGNGSIELKVLDEGIGIAADEKQKIFTKFYRVGNENTRKTNGTGLGLFLSKKIAKAHQANISVKDNQPQGSIFTVSFKHDKGKQ